MSFDVDGIVNYIGIFDGLKFYTLDEVRSDTIIYTSGGFRYHQLDIANLVFDYDIGHINELWDQWFYYHDLSKYVP